MGVLELFVAVFVIFTIGIVLYSLFYSDYKNSKLGKGVVSVPPKRNRSRLIDSKYGGIVEVISNKAYGTDKQNYTMQTSDGIVNGIYYNWELLTINEAQVFAGSAAPLYMTFDTLKEVLNINKSNIDGKIENSGFVVDLQNKIEIIQQKNNLLTEEVIQLRANTKEEVDGYIEKLSIIEKGKSVLTHGN